MFSGRAGVYHITHVQSGKMYIGGAVDIDRRLCTCKYTLRKGTHPNHKLQSYFNRYGEEAFTFGVLDYVEDVEELAVWVKQWVDTAKPWFNIRRKPGDRCCTKCGKSPPEASFYVFKNTGQRSTYCKACSVTKYSTYNKVHQSKRRITCYMANKNSEYKRKYGVTLEQIKELWELQKKCCAICEKPIADPTESTKYMVHLDHCHKTGLIRGVLCRHCNLLLGHAKDSIKALESAIAYLQLHNTQW